MSTTGGARPAVCMAQQQICSRGARCDSLTACRRSLAAYRRPNLRKQRLLRFDVHYGILHRKWGFAISSDPGVSGEIRDNNGETPSGESN